METLGQRLQHALDTRKKMSVEVARSAGISEAAISQWMKGTTKNVRAKNLLAVANYLRCNPQWLAEGVGESGLDSDELSPPIKFIPRAQPDSVRTMAENLATWLATLDKFQLQDARLALEQMAEQPADAARAVDKLARLSGEIPTEKPSTHRRQM